MPKSANSHPNTGIAIAFVCSWYLLPESPPNGRSRDDFPPRLAFDFSG
jgi:hypothetical protein